MTVSTTTNVSSSAGNGVTTAFSFNHIFYDEDHLVVTVDGITKTISTDYTVSGEANPAGGTVTFLSAPANGTEVVITRTVPYSQDTDFEDFDGNPSDVTEKQFDLCVMMSQQLKDANDRALKAPVGEAFDGTLPAAASRASKYLAFDVDGDPIVTEGTDDATPISAFMATVVDDETAAEALATLGFSTFIQTLINDADAATARSTLGAAALGANSDITSLTGLTTQLAYPQDFRLTLTTATPVTTSDVTGATTIYCTPYKGNAIALYNGTKWNTRNSAEFSLALGTLTSGKPYDVFCYDNNGVPTLEFLAWTSDTARATALAYQNGVLVKSGDATRRYIGTFYTTSTTQTEDSASNRYLWNYYNRVERKMQKSDATSAWAYTNATIRYANNNSANIISFICGVPEEPVHVNLFTRVSNTNAGVQINNYIGLDSGTAGLGFIGTYASGVIPGANYTIDKFCDYAALHTGKHFYSWLEASVATGTTTWDGGAIYGLSGSIRA